MKICIPVESQNGLETKVFGHFGSAPYFLLYDTGTKAFEMINNHDQHHIHGMCHPLKALENKKIDVVVCAGMGARAVQKLNEGGIRAYKATEETVQEIINKYREGTLEEITPANACVQHDCH